ncbi:hypothetical protein BH11MYX3_BH11MYX3_18100 [soil metagenome]
MKRSLLSLTLLGVLGSVAAAQPGDSAPPTTAADPPAPADPAVAPTTEPAPTPTPVPPPEEPKPAPKPEPTKLNVGKEGLGRMQPGILMQGWFLLDRNGGKTTTSTFRLRRAEISAKGEILPKRVAFQLMFDPAKVREPTSATLTDSGGDTVMVPTAPGAISVLQDFYITFLHDKVDVSVGQFKIPVSWEGYNSSAKIIMPERALISSLYGDKRDLGIRLAKTFKKWGYSAGIFNGQGVNNLDTNIQKDLALRLEAYPVEGLTLAAVTYDSVGVRDRAGTKDRQEADVRYEHGPFLAQAEYIRARDVKKDGADAVTAHGFYAAFGYTIKDKSLCGDLQPVVRVGYVDPDVDSNLDPAMGGDDERFHYDVGVNYYLKANEMKLQASYQRVQFDSKTPNVNEVIVAAQVNY